MHKLVLVATTVFLAFNAAAVAETPPRPQLAQSCDPSFGGKYSGLIRRLHIPGDVRRYGYCRDYGRWNGSHYKGYGPLPRGAFWTYRAPYWYLWARRGGGGRPGGARFGCTDPTFGGKYSGLIRRLRIPGDVRRYGRCRDYGIWRGRFYKGFGPLPRGYWVYSAPYWLIWARRNR